ncbi:hypothetical protein GGS23DRAFT_84251 [Durotheca rogersii]|uniref:uncharacterized protein n=1 Tax=Durotheca rogersii TaxID=419775 RepID=UPI00221F6A2C|nr:uncharacterized protein GGS23DRAFT_84251 [Durotheca rogersii]KAI5862605.1 hypothetical protein GGS23DRAFT_84251 [Durotheca rogersii]
MACSAVREALAQALDAPNQADAFEPLLDSLRAVSTPETATGDVKAFVDAVFSPLSSLGANNQRTLLNRFVAVVRHQFDGPQLWIDAAQHALAVLAAPATSSSSPPSDSSNSASAAAPAAAAAGAPSSSSAPTSASSGTFIEQVAALRELAADGFEAADDHAAAARALAEIPLDSSQRRVSDQDRVGVWVRIVRNLLEVDDTAAAETYLNKLKNVIYQVQDPVLNLHFRLSQARIQDAKREFLPASQAYHDISLSPAVSEDERLHTLGMAVRCAILAPAGPLRRRALDRLFRDERAPHLPEFGMLEKMFLDRLLAPAEVRKFAEGLAPHQLAITADGSTVLARAVVEHNLLSASLLYSNIGFDGLARLLGLDEKEGGGGSGAADDAASRAEDITARMIEQGRLVGHIDQVERTIWFGGGGLDAAAAAAAAAEDKGPTAGAGGSGGGAGGGGGGSGNGGGDDGSHGASAAAAAVAATAGGVGREMRRWDANVQSLAEELESATNALQREFPAFVAANLVV